MKIRIKQFLKVKEPPTSAQPPAVFRLCDDVLTSIFTLNVEQLVNIDHWMESEIPKTHRPILQCTTRRTSQVCRRWRQVALTCPALWSNIELSLMCLQWIREMIRRTMRNGFNRVSLACYNTNALFLITPELLSRVYSYYGVASMNLRSLLTNELMGTTTRLESLFVFPAITPNSFESLISAPSLMLDIVIKPSLKRLSFDSYFPIDITHSNLSSITTFVIQQVFTEYLTPEYTISEILSALANMPLLRELSLFVSFQDGVHQLHSINLPFLTRLKLKGSYFSISLLLSNIDFPPSCSLRISCEKSNDTTLPTTDMLGHILTPVAKSVAYGSTQNLTIFFSRNELSIKEVPPMSNTARSRKDDVWYTKLCCTPFFATVHEWMTLLEPVIAIFGGVFRTTTHLTLSSLVDFNHAEYLVLHLLQSFVTLDTIHLNGYSISTNLVSLFKAASENGEEDLLPALRNIGLFELTGYTPSFDALLDLLAWRVERNKGIHTFDFHFRPEKMLSQRINITKRQFSRLRQFVVDINVYYLKDSSNYSRWFIKTAILPPTFGNADGYCRLELFDDIPDDGLLNKKGKKRNIFRALGR